MARTITARTVTLYVGRVINTTDWKTGTAVKSGKKWAYTHIRSENPNSVERIVVWADNPEIFEHHPRAVVIASISGLSIAKRPLNKKWYVTYMCRVHLQESSEEVTKPSTVDVDTRQGAGSAQEKSAKDILAELFGVEV